MNRTYIANFAHRLAMFVLLMGISILALATNAAPSYAATGKVSFDYAVTANGNYLYYNDSYTFYDGWPTGGTGTRMLQIKINSNAAFCIEPGASLSSGSTLTKNYSSVWSGLSDAQKNAVNLALVYGFQGNKANLSGSQGVKIMATQLLVHEFITGCRSAEGNFAQIKTGMYNVFFGDNYANNQIKKTYNQIVSALTEHYTVPSFMSKASSASAKELEYKDGVYSLSITDSNKVLADFDFSCSSKAVSFKKSGNTLTITSTEPLDETLQISAERNNVPSISSSSKLVAWGNKANNHKKQDVLTGVEKPEAVVAYMNVETPLGALKLLKTSEDDIVEGLSFRITSNDDVQDAVDCEVRTDSDGTFVLENLPVGSYTVTEILSEEDLRYVEPQSKTVVVASGKTTTVSFSNVLKKWRLQAVKKDRSTTSAQGDATLGAAVYGLFKGEELVARYSTDGEGKFNTSYYVCDSDWSVREITPSAGYLLDETIYYVGAEPQNYTIEYNDVSLELFEEVLTGRIRLVKHSDNGQTGVETPETGAEFEVYLKSAGSWAAAEETERDHLIIDEDGFAQTKDLPYGVYVVHQVAGWEGRDFVSDFDVFISADDKTYSFILNDSYFESYIKIVKKDAETGETVPYAGAAFQIYDENGTLVTMGYTYPKPEVIDTFYTNDEGFLITPGTLAYGRGYSLVEVCAPYGYVLNSEPVYFDVVPEDSQMQAGITLIEVVYRNMPQKGTIVIAKRGEIFSTVTENDGMYVPVYSEEALSGASFEIRAAEDIYTPDGTLRAEQGEMVQVISCDELGFARSGELYLGAYEVREIESPFGMAINSEALMVELTYAGQEESVYELQVPLYNMRQKAALQLQKLLQSDEIFNIGSGDEILSVCFGLYASEDIYAADGTCIPADGLIELLYFDDKGISSCESDLPFGSYYLREIASDGHYKVNESKYPFSFVYEQSISAVIDIEINGGEPFINELIYGTIQGVKTDEDDRPLSGARIALFHPECSEFNEANAVLAAISAEDGSFGFEKVPYGTWIVREIGAPQGYELCDESFYVHIGFEGEVCTLRIQNNSIVEELRNVSAQTGDGTAVYGVLCIVALASLCVVLAGSCSRRRAE